MQRAIERQLSGDVDDHAHDDHSEDGLVSMKLLILVLMLVCCFVGVLPKTWGKCRNSERCMSLLNCFAGGVFLGVALLHIGPQSQTVYRLDHIAHGENYDFPWPFLMFFFGYMAVLLIDRVIAGKFHAMMHNHNGADTDRPSNAVNADGEKAADTLAAGGDATPAPLEIEGNGDNVYNGGKATVSTSTAIALIIAIGFHAIFEGMAVGLMDTATTTLELGFGIVIHKAPAAMALGTTFTKAQFSTKGVVALIALFSILSPIGVIIGMLMHESIDGFIQALILAFTAGTFIYIGCSEIIVKEFADNKDALLKYVIVAIGGGLIASLLWVGHGHDHNLSHHAHDGDDHHLLV